ncbi:tetratricopeptide repeat protein [Rhodanobacter sp. B05]|uniref:tetratricopeptide repeat protein n=1 Tax=Rhodanobacter sp. B05 TaxID=1945859 RepID=UPI0020C40C6E|nr:tetratricopeptide repeat protein [Rhodanobacter sp. B05]
MRVCSGTLAGNAYQGVRGGMAKPGFFEELKRRHVYRVAIAYAVAGWLLVQVATQVFPFFHIPDWSVRLIVLLVVIGFPIAVILAWVFELTPEGIRRTEPADSVEARSEAATHQIGRKLNTLTIVVLVLAVAALAWRQFMYHPTPAASTASADTVAVAATKSAADVPAVATTTAFAPPADTLVVLPFVNRSGDARQNYFSDGITEELTSALGQNTELRVIAWDTASKYRESKQTAVDIGQALNVANLLHGSIQRDNDTVRVSAELVDTRTGYEIWAQHYDDSLKNIFAVQDHISQAIAAALKVKLAATHATQAVDPQAHDLVLKGLASMNSRAAADYEAARRDFEQAIALDPNYAAAHAGLARALYDLTQFSTLTLQEVLPKVRAEAGKALALDPDNVDAIIALASADSTEGNVAKAKAGYERALRIDPSNAIARLDYALVLPLKQALAETLKAAQLDPQNATAQNNLATNYLNLGEYQQALSASQALLRLTPHIADTAFNLAMNYALLHRDQDAVHAFDLIQPTTPLDRQLAAAGKLAYQSVLEPKLHAQARAAADALHRQPSLDPQSLYDLMQVYLVLGDKDMALDLLKKSCDPSPQSCTDFATNPTYLSLRGDPRFQALAKRYDISTPQ